ncbi:protein jag [Sulfurovum sp. bin170]|nr:protein jag [Sulfurovum sp. bin170]
MKRIEATTLEEAYREAAKEFACSITEINYEIIQHPTTGMMGLFKKTAIIVAVKKLSTIDKEIDKEVEKDITKVEKPNPLKPNKKIEETPKEIKEEETKSENIEDKSESIKEKILKEQGSDSVLDSFFENKTTAPEVENDKKEESTPLEFNDDREFPKNRALSIEIEKKLAELMKIGCFDIDTVEVDVFNGIAHIFIDGEDAALLIGKEGYRYNALSYMLFNWINAHYNLYIKLEIAEFIQSQEEMIVNYLKPIIEHVGQKGRGKTKPLDGILVQIALELLRAEFPNKYVAIKTARDGRKFIIINDFNSSKK